MPEKGSKSSGEKVVEETGRRLDTMIRIGTIMGEAVEVAVVATKRTGTRGKEAKAENMRGTTMVAKMALGVGEETEGGVTREPKGGQMTRTNTLKKVEKTSLTDMTRTLRKRADQREYTSLVADMEINMAKNILINKVIDNQIDKLIDMQKDTAIELTNM